MSRSPAVLAAFAKLHLDQITSNDALAPLVAEASGPDVLKTIGEANRLSPIPLEVHAALNRALFQVADEASAREICRATVLASFRQPYLQPLVSGALKLLGNDLGRLARWAPKAYIVLFRDLGTMEWSPGTSGHCQLTIRDAPAALTEDADYLTGLGAGYEALFEIAGTQGELSIRASRAEVTMDLAWS